MNSLLDEFAMRRTAERYAMAVDQGDAAAFAALFIPDGVLASPRGRFVGRDALMGVPPMMKKLYDRTHHSVVGLVASVDGDAARADTYTLARHFYRDSSGRGYCYEMTVHYDDVFRRSDGEWLLASRNLLVIGDATYPTGRLHNADGERMSEDSI